MTRTRPKTLALVLAGGAGGRLELLTADRSKPAVPFGGTHRLIDFPLSNALHSGIADVWVVQQFNPVSLSDHLANGRPWDLDRTTGGLLTLHPRLGSDRGGWHQGTADALWRHADMIREYDPDALVVVSADAVYRLDYSEVVAQHIDSKAAVTMVTTSVDPDDAGRYGVVQTKDGRITDYAYKPDEPASDVVANEVFVLEAQRVLDVLEELAADAGEDGLQDLGNDLLPRLVDAGEAREYPLNGYWRDVGTVDSYWEGHQDLLGDEPRFEIDDRNWPIRTRSPRSTGARVVRGASLEDSLLAAGGYVGGTVTRSVLGTAVVIEPGAVVEDSVLMHGTVVRSGARVVRAVIDERVDVGRDARVGKAGGDLVLVGRGEQVAKGAHLEPGARQPQQDEDDD